MAKFTDRRGSSPARRRTASLPGIAAVVLAIPLMAVFPAGGRAATPANVYKIAKYPVQAQAEDAVTAKAQALADAQQGAFRSLMKRLVPVTAYKRLPKLPLARVQDMIAGFSVRSERNSTTEYLASYDFEFQARPVRELLRSSGLVTIEDMAPATVLVTAYGVRGGDAPLVAAGAKGAKATPPPAADVPAHLAPARVGALWNKAWLDLDTDNTLTPLRPAKSSDIPEQAIRRVLDGDWTALRALAGADTNSERTVLAYAEPTADRRKLAVTLIGKDALGWVSVTRAYPILDGDIAYATELAAVVGLGVLEGRWKALKTSRGGNGAISADGVDGWSTTSDKEEQNGGFGSVSVSRPAPSGWSDDIELVVEFRGLGQWQQMRRRLNETPGVEDLEIGQMSARTASVRLRYPGGAERLAGDLEGQGMQLTQQGGQWILQAR